MSLEMNQKRSETLIKKVDVNVDLLISRLQSIVALSASTSSQEIQASEMLQIESNSTMIIRLIEELLSVSRTLKENWILNQMPKTGIQNDLTIGIQDKMNLVIDSIIRRNIYDEETDDIDSDSDNDLIESKIEIKQEIKNQNLELKVNEEIIKDKIEIKEESKTELIENDLILDDFQSGNLDEIDFESFGNLENGDNDIIMLD